jgi:hypothetical protein
MPNLGLPPRRGPGRCRAGRRAARGRRVHPLRRCPPTVRATRGCFGADGRLRRGRAARQRLVDPAVVADLERQPEHACSAAGSHQRRARLGSGARRGRGYRVDRVASRRRRRVAAHRRDDPASDVETAPRHCRRVDGGHTQGRGPRRHTRAHPRRRARPRDPRRTRLHGRHRPAGADRRRRCRRLVLQDGHLPILLDQLQTCLAGHFDVEHSTFQFEPATHVAHEQAAHA